MQVGIIGGAILGYRVAVLAWLVWSLSVLGVLSLVLAVVLAVDLLIPTTLFCYMRWLCKSPFVFRKS